MCFRTREDLIKGGSSSQGDDDGVAANVPPGGEEGYEPDASRQQRKQAEK